jgi:hypothetical protein
MAMQVQTYLMKGLTKNVEALNTVRQQYSDACGTAAPALYTASGTGVQQQHAEADEFRDGSFRPGHDRKIARDQRRGHRIGVALH